MKKNLKGFLIPLYLLVPVLHANAQAGVPGANVRTTNSWTGKEVSGRAVHLASGAWGYEVLVDGKSYIRQELLPNVSGIHRFRNEADAAKVAALAVSKMQAGNSPFSITEDELRALKVL